MAFNPISPVNFTYKKYSAIASKQSVLVDVLPYTISLSITGAPSWLNAFNAVVVDEQGSFSLQLKTNVTNNLTAGNYTAVLTITADLQEPDMLSSETHSLGVYRVNLVVEDTLVLSIEPALLNFEYDPDAALPTEKLLRITSENDWSIISTESWVTLTASSGVDSASVYVGVDPSALLFGFHQATLTIDDGTSVSTVTVYLTITAAETSTDYLYLNPQYLEFLSEQGQVNTVTKSVTVDASVAWSVTSSDTWLIADSSGEDGGEFTIVASVVSENLEEGAYFGELLFTSAGITKKIFVALRVVAFEVSGIVNNTLYFSDDRNTLSVGSVSDNSFLVLDIESSSAGETKSYPVKQPYFQGIAKAILGLETNALIAAITPDTNFLSRIMNNISPMVMKITAYEEHRFTGYTPTVASYENLYFLKGKTPALSNRASYMPTRITVSDKAILRLSVISKTAPENVTITGAIAHTIQGAQSDDKYLYTALINLAEYELSHCDEIALDFGGHKVAVQVTTDYTELNTLAFENEWGDFEFFETRGFLTVEAQVSQNTTQRAFNGQAKTVIIAADQDASFSLSTGYIESNEEVVWLSRILNAKQVFILQDGVWLSVVLTTKKLEIYETRNHIHAYRLNFKKAVK